MAAADALDLLQMHPIGYLRSVFQFKNGTPRQPSLCSTARGSLTLEKRVFNNPDHALEGLEQFSHVWILFVFHKNRPGHTKAKVKPPRLNGKRVGVLSTRSPYRPNAIGLTLAKLERISGSTVHFSGIDIVDGTPVLDIKPFIPQYDVPACRGESLPEISMPVSDCCSDVADVATFRDKGYRDEKADAGTRLVSADASSSSCRYDDVGDQPASVTLEGDLSSVVKTGEMEEGEVCDVSPVGGLFEARETTAKHDLGVQIPLTSPEPLTKPGLSHVGGKGFWTCPTADKHSSVIPFSNSSETDKNETAHHRAAASTESVLRDKTTVAFNDQDVDGVASLEPDFFHDEVPRGKQPDASQPGERSSIMEQERDSSHVSKTKTSNSGAAPDAAVAQWLSAPPVTKLQVTFTPNAEAELRKWVTQSASCTDSRYRLDFLSGEDEVRAAIVSVLSEDPRSVYRRQKCRDSLYFFTVDQVHVTCWFDDHRAEVVRLQPLSCVEKLKD